MGRPLRNEAQLSQTVADFVRRKFRCHVTTELKVGNCQFDVVGFNEDKDAFYVVETKLGFKPAAIGHAFGQLLAYEAVISQDGYRFIGGFFDKLANKEHDPVPFDVSSRVRDEESITVHRFVALTDKACDNYRLIKDLRERLNKPVGVIRCDKRCTLYLLSDDGTKDSDVCKSEPVSIDITKRYDKQEFLTEVSRRLRRLHPDQTVSFYPPRGTPRFFKLTLGHGDFHLECHASEKLMTLSLDVEPEKRRDKDEFFEFAKMPIQEAKWKIHELEEERNWLSRGRWGRIVVKEDHPTLNEDSVKRSVDTMDKLYVAMKPVVDEFVRREEANRFRKLVERSRSTKDNTSTEDQRQSDSYTRN